MDLHFHVTEDNGDQCLSQIRCALLYSSPVELSGSKRASVGLLLRKNAKHGLDVLFIRRSSRKGDRWSGDVALPGGKVEKGETEHEAVIREVQEEIGLDLNQKDTWECLGRLDDRKAMELTVRCYVFLQVRQTTPRFTLQESEVAACAWCPLHYLCLPTREVQIVARWPITRFRKGRSMSILKTVRLPWLLGFDEMCYNALDLPVYDGEPLESGPFRLWGLTFTIISDFTALPALRPRHDALKIYPRQRIFGIEFDSICKSPLQGLLAKMVLPLARAVFGNSARPAHATVGLMLLEVSAIAAAGLYVVGKSLRSALA